MAISAGIIALLGLLFILSLKYLELLPPEVKEETATDKGDKEPGKEVIEETKEALEPTEGSVATSEG